jgi:phosphatidylglycerol---prolipoprotein diacylglyceryl transferase
MLSYPHIDPVLISVGPLAIRWYSLAYIAGILGGWWLLGRVDARSKRPMLSPALRDDIVVWAIGGIILGGRIGYILFYNLPYFLHEPTAILKVWEGGMSFHGGLLGVLIAFGLLARKHKVNFFELMDRIALVTPIGLFFGRLANFINGELFGRVTDSPFGMVFPYGGALPRHPSQLYEAGLEGVVLGVVLWLAWRAYALDAVGRLGGLFLAGYGVCRFVVEFAREPDAQLGLLALQMSMGQWLCVPMIAYGTWLVSTSSRRKVSDVVA